MPEFLVKSVHIMVNRTIPILLVSVMLAAGCQRAEGEATRTSSETASPGGASAGVGSPEGAGIAADDRAAEPEEAVAEETAESLPATELAPQPLGSDRVEVTEGASADAAPVPTSVAQSSAEEILRRVEQVYADMRTMRAEFVQHLTVPLLSSTQRSEGTMYQKRPDRFLMRFTEPAGDVIVADGTHFWMYHPSVDRTQVLRARMTDGGAPMDFQREFISNPTRRYVATLAGSEVVAGRDAHLISLVPRGSSPYRLIRVWVDKQDHTIRQFEMTEENDSVRRIEFRTLQRDIELDDGLFRFTPPAGTQVFDQ
jgi:outer membrane lipoprotein carrier protein